MKKVTCPRLCKQTNSNCELWFGTEACYERQFLTILQLNQERGSEMKRNALKCEVIGCGRVVDPSDFVNCEEGSMFRICSQCRERAKEELVKVASSELFLFRCFKCKKWRIHTSDVELCALNEIIHLLQDYLQLVFMDRGGVSRGLVLSAIETVRRYDERYAQRDTLSWLGLLLTRGYLRLVDELTFEIPDRKVK